jgi:hypothetical protein
MGYFTEGCNKDNPGDHNVDIPQVQSKSAVSEQEPELKLEREYQKEGMEEQGEQPDPTWETLTSSLKIGFT